MLKKAKKEWHGTHHPVYGLIEKDKEYEVKKEDENAKMWEGVFKKKQREMKDVDE